MTDRHDSTQPNLRDVRQTSAPPQFLFWLVLGLFLLILIASAAAFFIYRSEGRLVGLVQPVIFTLVAAAVYVFVLTVVFRRTLPRFFSLGLLIAYIVIGIVGVVAGISFYQTNIPPRYQTELLTPFPFLSAYLPPTPLGGVLPTVSAPTNGLSAQDLLLGPVAGSPTPSAPLASAVSPTATAALSTPTIRPTQTQVTPLPTQTALPTATLAPLPTATVAAAAAIAEAQPVSVQTASLPAVHYNGGFRSIRQGWNNCGPANIAQALSYYGWQGSQEEAASFLKPEPEDKNVSPTELVRFVNTQSAVRALTRVGGSVDLLKAFIAGGFPVIVEVGGALYEGEDWIGHYRTLVGYDDANGVFLVYDTWLGNGDGDGLAVPYAEMDDTWRPFNRVFVVVYEPQREADVVAILGPLSDVESANELALDTARTEARANPQDPFAWFNVGSSLTRLGRYEEAALAFDEANRFRLPFRMIWYQFYPFEAYFETGRYSDVTALINSNLNSSGTYIEETYYWQGRVLEAQGDVAGAREAFQRALVHNNRYDDARAALDALSGT